MDAVPRSNRPRRGGRPAGRSGPAGRPDGDGDDERPFGTDRPLGVGRVEEHAGEEFAVRTVTGAAATKTYRCPGCDHEIPPGTPHVVAWSLDARDGAGRRHWHTACWTARSRRGPRR